ncbi:PREDICTED: cytoplasmic tRNA 2-thiolation protein 2-A-like isoform X2 [Amphimedon queenslandica]|uniref:Cytoplasmic tRNA 2-thiolation protein 2 n=1 Tax=Amphimedon queenslandica TaxID=400682 RepID=A0A1X7UMS6_AMPQE|nr:PREDICTED: cytoplasmic tRNA 2-thiolation protein 2-A-like isoform X2 [Amphimedon queenslandica]|eukprot:XP_011404570.2 PREDICTED: cytoplasmic tRNA 2-thiolation protein 2-A-like isoform X2 [Amphimedon queenslandica]
MCSVNEDEVQEVISSPPPLNLDQVCMKCNSEKAVTIARTKDPFCRACFDQYFTHRFRSTFGKSRLIRQGEEVLLAFSGGQSSRVLLHLVQEGLSEHAVKRLRFTPIIIYIDEGVVYGYASERQKSLLKEVSGIIAQTQFPGYFTKLEEVFTGARVWPISDAVLSAGSEQRSKLAAPDPTSSISQGEMPGEVKLKQLFDSLKSSTAKEDMLQSLRRQLLVDIAAKYFNTGKILVGDNATRLSVRLLGNIAQGRGGTIPLDTGFCDNRSDVMVLRPLREFPDSEIASYLTLHQLQSVDASSDHSLPGSSGHSIEGLTASFVHSLQSNFSSTVSTIFRTSDKLQLSEDLVHSGQCCPLCQAPCEESFNEEVFSHVSTSGNNKLLCYGCRLTARGTVHENILELLLKDDSGGSNEL